MRRTSSNKSLRETCFCTCQENANDHQAIHAPQYRDFVSRISHTGGLELSSHFFSVLPTQHPSLIISSYQLTTGFFPTGAQALPWPLIWAKVIPLMIGWIRYVCWEYFEKYFPHQNNICVTWCTYNTLPTCSWDNKCPNSPKISFSRVLFFSNILVASILSLTGNRKPITPVSFWLYSKSGCQYIKTLKYKCKL